MSRAYVDANLILRFLVGDPPEMAEQAAHLFQAVEAGQVTLIVDDITVTEVVWVLQSFYKHTPANIAAAVRDLLLHTGITADDKDTLLYALSLYETKNVDFADALLAARMQKRRIEAVFSFDNHFDQLPGD
jgi:predicted nucleic acid-binding protein